MPTFRAAVAAIALALIPAPAALADDSGLVAAYGFEEPGSVAVDSSGSGNDGTISGTTVVNGRFGKSRYFDGVDDRIDVPDSSSLDLSSGMTLEAWVHSPRSGWRTVLAKERAGGVVYGLYGSSDTNFPAAKVRTTADFEVRGKSTISFWQHVAATYDGATLRLYVDGSPQASRAVSGPIEMSNGALRIGGNSILGQYFQGYVDEVKIYNRALSALELQTDQFKAVNVPDTVAPDAINDLTFTVTDDDVRLDFGEPNDNFGVGSYRVYRDGLPIATIGSLNTDYTDANRPAGTYRYTVTALDGAGNESPVSNEVVVPITFGLDVTPPTARFDAGCNGARTHSEIYLTPTVSDDRGSVTARVEVDGAVIYGPRDVASPSTLAVTWQTRYVPDGLHTMKLIARDAAGNETVTDCVWNVDNFAVTATLAGPTNGATVHGTIDLDADVFVDGEPIADDWSGWYPAEHPVNKVRFRIDGWNGIGAPTAPDAPFVTTLDTTELSNGPHTISAEVEWIDFTTRASTQTITINVDNTPSAPTGVTATATGTSVNVSWDPVTATPPVQGYRIYRGAMEIGGATGTSFTDKNVPPGTHRYTVAAVNAKGVSRETAAPPVTVAPDTTPPTVTLDAGCDGRTLSEFVGPIFGTATDDSAGTVSVRVDVDGQSLWGPYNLNGQFHFDWDTRKYANGPHVMKVIAFDQAGNQTVKDCPWTVANSELSVPITGAADGETVHGTVALGFQPRSDGSASLSPAFLQIDGVTVANTPIGPYTYSWDSTKVANGLHTIKAAMYWRDYPSVMATATIQVRVDNSPPATPTGVAAAVTDDDVHLTWDAVTGASSYRVLRDGSQIATVPGTSYTDADRPLGTYDYTVVAVNDSGASDPSAKATVTVADTTAPALTVDAGCDGRTLSDFVGPITGTATDDRGGDVTVRVLVDDATIWGPNTVTGAFQFNWDTRTVANGPRMMKVIARDAAGNETVKNCPWTVANSVLSVPITGAQDGGTVSGTVALGFQPKADGAAAIAPAFLEIDGTRVADKPIGPYTYSWDTTKVANGVHTIKAGMYWRDYPNPMATATIQVTVANAAPAPTGLVAAYGFEQTSGTSVTDSSGKGSTGTLSGATWVTGGKFGRALSFDGVNDIVSVPDSNLLDLAPGMTLEAWVKPTTVSGWRTVLLKERPGQLTYALYAAGDSGRPLTEVTAGTQRDARNTAALPVGVWTHLAATYDKSTLRLYVNGTQVASTAVSGTLVNSTRALKIGGNTIWGEYFAGLIDEVRVYERALTPAEIAADKDRAV